MSYEEMASVYDALMEYAPYDKWLTFTEILFKRTSRPITSVLDLGCGTGQITRRLAASGYETVGVDISEDMLTYADHRAQNEQLSIQWIHQDVSQLAGLSSFDAAVSYCDVMNYITTEQALDDTFNRVYDALAPDGIFIFDVHAISYVKEKLVDRTFADVADDIAYIWFCQKGDHAGEMYHDLTFFVEDQNDKFDKFSEVHHERTFPVRTYIQLLEGAGFENCKVYADFAANDHFSEDNAERIFFSATKPSGK